MAGAWSSMLPMALAGGLILALVRTSRLRSREPGWALRQRTGLLLLATPLIALVLFGASSLSLLTEGITPAPMTPGELKHKAIVHAALYLAVPALGLLLVLGPRRSLEEARGHLTGEDPTPATIGRSLSLAAAFTGLLALTLTTVWTLAQKSGSGLLTAGGAEILFSEITPTLAFTLAAFAALAEEGLFRGVLLETLDAYVNRALAIGLQGVLFGLIHAGYGSLGHVLAASLFGVLMGLLVTRRGLLPAVLVHFLVNVAILGLWTGHTVLLLFAVASVPALAGAGALLRARHEPFPSPKAS